MGETLKVCTAILFSTIFLSAVMVSTASLIEGKTLGETLKVSEDLTKLYELNEIQGSYSKAPH